jgi:tRNA A37 threonylcarbamoyladenosine biosynthesis protein TsaE
MVQFPGSKIRWAVLIQSAEGAGKTFFAKVMQSVLGL